MKQPRQVESKDWRAAGFTGVLLLVASGLTLARLGLNPADEGFVLAGARRILSGQIPHRDFILTRPPLSQLLHIPEVLLFHSHLLLASRVVALGQFAVIAIAAVLSAQLVLPRARRWSSAQVAILTVVAFFGSLNSFPLMAWHSLDGVMLSAVGMFLVLRRRDDPEKQWLGLLVLASAYLSRQNFALVAPTALVLFGGWRYVRNWVAIALPAACYLVFILAFGLGADVVPQLLARTEVVQTGLFPLLGATFLLAVILGLLVARYAVRAHARKAARIALAAIAAATSLVAIVTMGLANVNHVFTPYWLPSGVLLGFTLGSLRDQRAGAWARYSALVFAIAWSSGVSLGWNYPALFTGGLIVALLSLPQLVDVSADWHAFGKVVVGVAVVAATLTVFSRVEWPYQEVSLAQLTFHADGKNLGVAGLEGLQTNPVLGSSLEDLALAKNMAHGRYAIIPDLAMNWATDPQANPLPTDWPDDCEIPSQPLQSAVVSSIESQRGKLTFIVFKGWPEYYYLKANNAISPSGEGFATRYVRQHFREVDETTFFRLYR